MMSKLRHFFCSMLLIFGVFFGSTPLWAQGLAEYALILAVVNSNDPTLSASVHSACNKVTITKSPVNNKSLNPLCQQCISQQDEGISSRYISMPLSVFIPDSGLEGSLSACLSTNSSQGFSSQFSTDTELMCSTRGGIYAGAGGSPLVICFLPTNLPPT